MVDQNTFMETLRSVAEIARNADTPLTKEETAGYFKDMDLSSEQQEQIYQYLHQQQEHTDSREPQSMEKDGITEAELPGSMVFQMYRRDLQKIKTYTPEEENALYQQLAAGDGSAVGKLSGQWMSRVLRLAKKHASSARELADVIQEGNIGVFQALNSLLGSGIQADYKQLLTEAAEEAMAAYLLDTASVQDMEQSVLAKASLVYRAQRFLAEEFQRLPTTAELSQYTRLTEDELEDILALSIDKRKA